ncbi:SDR family NAD(P)-dependent oxidoreductase [Embleya sp. NPDC059259]|uniref:SDR family NAD(P)-dependent oxidoreductase n=1 Tax=unclassified Embleya TaxID=2699296 RepID=UPI00369B684B
MHKTPNGDHGAEGALTIMLTGATAGTGRATASALAGRAGHLVLHGPEREDEVAELLRAVRKELAPGARLDYFAADYANPAEVARLVRRVRAVTDRIDLLVNNAERPGAPARTVNAGGTELTFRTNYLAPVQLTDGLIDLIGDRSRGRIVNVASGTHLTTALHPDDPGLARHPYSASLAHAHAGLALVTYSRRLARHRPRHAIDVVAMDPAWMSTHPGAGSAAGADRPDRAAADIRHVAALCDDNGAWYHGRAPGPINPQACDHGVQERLHDITEFALRGGL